MWKKPPPLSRKLVDGGDLEDGTSKMRRVKQQEQNTKEKVLKSIDSDLCIEVLQFCSFRSCMYNALFFLFIFNFTIIIPIGVFTEQTVAMQLQSLSVRYVRRL
jgi:hypothetical protein